MFHKYFKIVKLWLEAQLENVKTAKAIMVLDDVCGYFSPDDFTTLCMPYMKEIFSSFPELRHYFHNDFTSNSCYPHLQEMGVDVFNFTHTQDIVESRKMAGDKVVLMGGLFADNPTPEYNIKTDIPSEASGNIPKAACYDKLYRGVWNALTVRSLSIGQGEILVTPLQLANLAAAIGNEGYYYPPHLIKSFSDGTPIDSNMTTKRIINIKPKHFKDVKVGMCRVFEGESGTARYSAIDSIQVAGKTGTSQVMRTTDTGVTMKCNNGFFISFAPYDDPQIAIAVVAENALTGSRTSQAAADVYNYYFGQRASIEESQTPNTLIG